MQFPLGTHVSWARPGKPKAGCFPQLSAMHRAVESSVLLRCQTCDGVIDTLLEKTKKVLCDIEEA